MKKFFSIITAIAASAVVSLVALAPSSASAQDITYERATITNVAGSVTFTFTNTENRAFGTFLVDSIVLGATPNSTNAFAVDFLLGSTWLSNACTQTGTAPLLNLTNRPALFIGDKLKLRSVNDTNTFSSKLNYRKAP